MRLALTNLLQQIQISRQAACTEDTLVSALYRPRGIRSEEVFDWLLALPQGSLCVGFSLGYDRTKWFESMPDERVWKLMHPEARRGKIGPRPVGWKGYKLNLVSTRFTVKRASEPRSTRTVWDVWKFYQCAFVVALAKWDVGTAEEREAIAAMKKRRGSFAGITKKEKDYCQSECKLLATLMRRLMEAHEAEDMHLPAYFGPGSTATVILKRCGAEKETARLTPKIVRAAACAYFGGRFEVSRVGPVRARAVPYDIASAYPYALATMPCMRHGRWRRRVGSAAEDVLVGASLGKVALVRYTLRRHRACNPAWGPLPFRLPDGNILFPLESAGGWVFAHEARAGLSVHPGIVAKEAWEWVPTCDCPPPFRDEIVRLYKTRLEVGKSSRGIVVKLALNSMYGKSAQRVGRGKYRCIVRAGYVTATTRSMLLTALTRVRDPWDVLELATDSVLTLKPMALPIPWDLGTLDAARAVGEAELGAWEEKEPHKEGVFLLRPGLRFALGKHAALGSVAARGLGTKNLFDNRQSVLDAWRRAPMGDTTVQQPSFFHGAKLSVSKRARPREGTCVALSTAAGKTLRRAFSRTGRAPSEAASRLPRTARAFCSCLSASRPARARRARPTEAKRRRA